jgi:ABC-type glycerol-3-phosphate transport system substrate-binding protein
MSTKKRTIAAAAIAGLALLSACGGGAASKDAAGTLMDTKRPTTPVDPNKVDPAKFNKAHGSNGKVALNVNNGCTSCHD